MKYLLLILLLGGCATGPQVVDNNPIRTVICGRGKTILVRENGQMTSVDEGNTITFCTEPCQQEKK